MPERNKRKDTSLNEKAKIFLTPLSTYNLFPELDKDLFLGKKAEAISYNVTKIILSHHFEDIQTRTSYARNDDEQTVLISAKRQGAELISLALQLQGYEEKGFEPGTEGTNDRFLKLTRNVAMVVENGVLMNKNFSGPPWEKVSF